MMSRWTVVYATCIVGKQSRAALLTDNAVMTPKISFALKVLQYGSCMLGAKSTEPCHSDCHVFTQLPVYTVTKRTATINFKVTMDMLHSPVLDSESCTFWLHFNLFLEVRMCTLPSLGALIGCLQTCFQPPSAV